MAIISSTVWGDNIVSWGLSWFQPRQSTQQCVCEVLDVSLTSAPSFPGGPSGPRRPGSPWETHPQESSELLAKLLLKVPYESSLSHGKLPTIIPGSPASPGIPWPPTGPWGEGTPSTRISNHVMRWKRRYLILTYWWSRWAGESSRSRFTLKEQPSHTLWSTNNT